MSQSYDLNVETTLFKEQSKCIEMKAVIQNVEWSQQRYVLYSDAEYNDDRKSFPNKD